MAAMVGQKSGEPLSIPELANAGRLGPVVREAIETGRDQNMLVGVYGAAPAAVNTACRHGTERLNICDAPAEEVEEAIAIELDLF